MMRKQATLMLLIFLVGVFMVHAQEEHTMKLTLKQAEGNKEIKNVLVNLIIFEKESKEERTTTSFIRSNPITLRLPKGEYKLTFKIDNLQTPGKDYYAEQEIVLDKSIEQEIIVFPVGSLKGVVYDTLNNLVSKAALKVECSKDYGEKVPEFTDRVGSFSVAYAPIDECVITATSDNAVGSGKINIKPGDSQNIEIRLNRAVISEGGNGWVVFWSILVLLVVGITGWFGWRFWQKRHYMRLKHEIPQKEKNIEQQKPEEKTNKRIQDVLSTLNEKEKKVVTFLLNNHHNSTQAKIRYETGIPKTTLVRIFMSLQNKKIIAIETVGKLKKIQLTNWFLDKEN